MRRFIALIIMLVIPLQFAWAAAASLHGHLGENVATLGVHAHDHDHHEHGPSDHDAAGDTGTHSSEDGQHGNHCHPVFSSLIMESGLPLGLCLSGGPLPHPPEVFYSRIPPLLDRPPLAHA